MNKTWIDTTREFILVVEKCAILILVVTMKIFFRILIILLLSGCQTIEKKSQIIIKEENKKLSKFLQGTEEELKITMGIPDNVVYDDKGSKFFVYYKKKYNITCERKFEIDKNKIIVGFSSKGCF